MMTPATRLEMAERHVRRAERHIQEQQNIIEQLADQGRSTADAEALLALFRMNLDEHRRRLDRLTRLGIAAPPCRNL